MGSDDLFHKRKARSNAALQRQQKQRAQNIRYLIVCEGAVDAAPAAWTDALAPGGRLGVVERTGPVGHAVIYRRNDDGLGRRVAFDSTPPVLAGFEARSRFAL